MLYLDTSIVVAALTNEPQTRRMQLWLGEQEAGHLAISDWVGVEFSTALSMKLRAARMAPGQRAAVLAQFARLTADALIVLPVATAELHAAAGLADRTTLGLRAGDALHLAVASLAGATVCTLDRRLALFGDDSGVPTLLL